MREVVPLVQLIVVELEGRREEGKGGERDRRKGRFATSYFSKHTQMQLSEPHNRGTLGALLKNTKTARGKECDCGCAEFVYTQKSSSLSI